MRLKRFNESNAETKTKQFAITTKSESGDYYMYFVESIKNPTIEELEKFLLEHGNDIDESGYCYEEVEIIREIKNFIKL